MSVQECEKPQLQLFEPKKFSYNVVKTESIVLKPLATVENAGAIEFRDSSYSDHYRVLGTIYLHLKVKMTHKDDTGVAIDETTKPLKEEDLNVYPVNNLLHSLFKQVTLSLNNQRVAVNGQNYAYRYEGMIFFRTRKHN